jgi:putative transposase
MSRPLRIQYPGAWYHVMNRGLNHRRIFHNVIQRHMFLKLLDDIHNRYHIQTHAYCLMDNHYHLLLHTPEGNLSRAMRHLDGLYTQQFNRQENRDGPLFRGRYKAILIEAENYGLELTRYIHLNPVSANICSNPEDYIWSSYNAYLHSSKKPKWLYCNEMLERCSGKISIKDYREFIEKGVSISIKREFSKKNLPSLLGSNDWIENLKKQFEVNLVVDSEVPESKELQLWSFTDIDRLVQQVANHYGLTIDALKKRSNRYVENKARNILIYLAILCGFENKKIANMLGNIGDTGVSRIRRQMEIKLETDSAIQIELKRVREVCGLESRMET